MMKSVTDGNGTTHFFDMPNTRGAASQAMLFIPLTVSLVEQVPMLIYFHGHNSKHSIEDYVTSMTQRDFRPLLKDKKVLLVEPWGGHMSHFGPLGTEDGVANLISQAMFYAISNGPPVRPCPVNPPSPPSLILAGFSGGGAALGRVGRSSSAAWHSLVSEIWCFDCMYSGEGSAWVTWARDTANASRKLRVCLSTGESSGSPRAQGAAIKHAIGSGPSNVEVNGPVSSGHEDLPAKFIPGWL